MLPPIGKLQTKRQSKNLAFEERGFVGYGVNYGYNLRRQFDKCTPVAKFVPQGMIMTLGVPLR